MQIGNFRLLLGSVVLAASIVATGSSSFGGPLTPPAGAITPTRGIDPRTPVTLETCPGDNDSSPSVLKITQSGSYYLTANVVGVAGKHGIEIAAPMVTLDLNGFTVQGVSGSKTGVLLTNAANSAEVRNGKVTGWGGDGLGHEGAPGYSKIIGVLVSANIGSGILLNAYSQVRECEAFGNGVDGIRVSAKGRIESCSSLQNARYGFYVSNSGNIVSKSVATNNGDDGFNAFMNNMFVECLSMNNLGDGFNVNRAILRACFSNNNSGNGFVLNSGSHISDSIASQNSAVGFSAGNACQLINNNANGNGTGSSPTYGFAITGVGSRVVGNLASFNGNGFSIPGTNCVVSNNTASNNDSVGFFVQSNTNALLTANVSTANTTNYTILSGNDTGAIITNPGAGFTTTNPAANIAN